MERTKVKMLTVGYITNSSRDSFKPLLTEMSKTYNIEKLHKEEATFQNIKETLPPKSIILWRILNANQTKAKNLAEKLTEEGHILNEPQHRDIDLLEHPHAAPGIQKRHILRR